MSGRYALPGFIDTHARGLRTIGHLDRVSWTRAAELGIDALTHVSDERAPARRAGAKRLRRRARAASEREVHISRVRARRLRQPARRGDDPRARRAAEQLDIGHRTGALAAGLEADIVLLRGNPLEDIAETANVDLVVVDGRAFTPAALLERASALVD